MIDKKFQELAIKSQREGRILFAYDYNSKQYWEIAGMKLKKISKAKYLEKQGQKATCP